MAEPVAVTAPALPELEELELPDGGDLDELELVEVLVERHGRDALASARVRVEESELRGLTLREGIATELVLRDARLSGCDLSNLRVRSADIRRVEIEESRLVGFGID